jgi:hypothetical protein
MARRIFAMMLSSFILLTTIGFQQVGAQSLKDQQATEKIKTKVEKIGVGKNARVDVKLRDNTQLKGYIAEANQDSFIVVERQTGSSKTVSYADASSVKKSGSGISTKTWIIIGAAAVGAAVTWAVVKPAFCDGGNITRFPC